MLPDIIGIGAPKSGTTSFIRALEAIDQFDVCRMKDSDIFSSDDFDDAMTMYQHEFKDNGRPKVDFSALYFLSTSAARNYAESHEEIKIVFLARDPIYQIKSHYWHIRRQNYHSWDSSRGALTLAQLLEERPEIILEPSLYAKNLRKWPWADGDKFLFMTYEETIKKPSEALDRFAKFCGLRLDSLATEMFCRELAQKHRAGVRPRSELHERLYRHLYVRAVSGPYQSLKRLIGVPAADRIKEVLRLRQLAQYLFFSAGKVVSSSSDDEIPQWAADIIEADKRELSLMFPGRLTYWQNV